MNPPPTRVDVWREWAAAHRAARRAKHLRNASEDDKRRAWRKLMEHLKSALTGKRPEEHPEQPRLFEE